MTKKDEKHRVADRPQAQKPPEMRTEKDVFGVSGQKKPHEERQDSTGAAEAEHKKGKPSHDEIAMVLDDLVRRHIDEGKRDAPYVMQLSGLLKRLRAK